MTIRQDHACSIRARSPEDYRSAVSFDGVSGTLTVAAVQATPVFLDRTATVEVAARHVAEADAELVVFPESFVPGYPDWVWRRSPMSDGDWYARLVANAVRVDGTDLDPLRDAARDAGAWVAVGVTERSGRTRSTTRWSTSGPHGRDRRSAPQAGAYRRRRSGLGQRQRPSPRPSSMSAASGSVR